MRVIYFTLVVELTTIFPSLPTNMYKAYIDYTITNIMYTERLNIRPSNTIYNFV